VNLLVAVIVDIHAGVDAIRTLRRSEHNG